MVIHLPKQIKAHLDLSDAYPPKIGYSPETIWILPHGYDEKPCVLKYSNRKEVYEEGVIYQWLKGKLPVPEVYFNEKIEGIYYLVVSFVEGEMLSETFQLMTKEKCLQIYGKLLAQIHQVDIKDFPYQHDKTYKLEKVKETVMNHEVKTQYFERELKGKRPEELFNYLWQHQNFDEDLVFTHGDVCFPNFIFENDKLQAVIDVSGAGINDRHLDIAIGLRTLRYNFEMIHETLTNDDIEIFLEAYGDKKIDMNKIKFYIVLDEMTNG